VVFHNEAELFGDFLLSLLYRLVIKFQNFTTICADDVVVMGFYAKLIFFALRSEGDGCYDPRIFQKRERSSGVKCPVWL